MMYGITSSIINAWNTYLCSLEQIKQYQQSHIEQMKEYKRLWYLKNKAKKINIIV